MATYATLTIPVLDIIGAEFNASRASVWIEPNVPVVLADGIRVGGRREQVVGGVATFANLVTTNSADNPTSFGYRVTITAPPKGAAVRKDNVNLTTSDFPLTTTSNLKDIPEAWDNIMLPASWRSDFRDEMEAIRSNVVDISNIDSTDTAVAAGFQIPGSESGAYLSATIAADLEASTEPGGAVWKVGPTAVNVRNYGVSTANTPAANDAALATIFTDNPSGVIVAFPDLGTFNFSEPLPPRSLMQIRGRGRQTVLNWTTGNALAISGSTLGQVLVFADVKLTNSGTASHLIDIAGTGGLIHSSFERCYIEPGVNGASILKADTNNLFGIYFRDCILKRAATATVPAFDIIGQAGSGTNNLHFEGGEWHSNTCSSSPFFKADTSSVSPLINLTFEKIIGEQHHGGMIHVAGATSVKVHNVIDMDSTTYADDLFKFSTSTGGRVCNAVDIDHAGSYGSATLGVGKAHLRIDAGTGHRVGWIPKDASQLGTIIVPQSGRTIRHYVDDARPFRTVTASETLTNADYGVLGSGTSITVSLPSVAEMPRGRGFVVKNIAATSLTLDTADAALIDGAGSVSLAQYEVVRLMTNGTNWYKV